MSNNPQQSSAGGGDEESFPADEIRHLKQQLKHARAEIAILELQLKEHSQKLQQKVDERTRELEAVNRIATSVSLSLELDVVLGQALSKVLELLELDVGGIFLCDSENKALALHASQGFPRDVAEAISDQPIGDLFPGSVVTISKPVSIQVSAAGGPDGELLAAHPEYRSMVGIPLESKGRIRGVMCILSLEEDRFTRDEIKLLVALGSEIGVAIENARLYEKLFVHSLKMEELSVTDSLTGLHNRRHFYRRIREEIARANRQRHTLSLLVVDLDKLKEFNDERGHLQGDEAIRGAARAITTCIRHDVDSGYRFGGDEFTVILPYSDEERAAQVAERIRNTYEGFDFPNTSLSIGLTQLRFEESMDDLVNRADTAMYAAKSSGGNRVHIERPTA